MVASVQKSLYFTFLTIIFFTLQTEKRDNAKDFINLSTIAAILPHAVYD